MVRVLLGGTQPSVHVEGQHLARCLRAVRRGLISRDDMAAVCQSLPTVSAEQIVADVLAPGGPAVTR